MSLISGQSKDEGGKALLDATLQIQALLVQQQARLQDDKKGPFFFGTQFTTADAAIAPFVTRAELLLSERIGAYKAAEGTRILTTLKDDPAYATYQAYSKALWERPSVSETFNRVCTGSGENHYQRGRDVVPLYRKRSSTARSVDLVAP